MSDPQTLLAKYAATGSEEAFRDLVNRYVDLVYSTAVRLVDGDTHRAEDVAQTVFADLARLARTLPAGVMLGGWLHRRTWHVAATLMRGERRRRKREWQAAQMKASDNPEPDFHELAPVLDETINQLSAPDRETIVLRFFERCDHRAMFEQTQPIRTAGSAKPMQESATAARQFVEYLSKESLAFAGYDNPDVAVQSCFWANTTLDGKAILAGFTPAQQEQWLKVHKTPEGVAAQVARCPVGANMDKVKGIRIINKQTPADDEVYYTVYVDGLGIGFKEKYKRIGSEWKFDGEYNVNWNP